MNLQTLDDGQFEKKHVLVRSDLNAPIENGEVRDCLRFERYKKTIKELSDKGAKVVVMAHQGRPNREDFKKLQEHAEILSEHLGREVRYIDEIFSFNVRTIIRGMEPGEVILLENVRILSEELRNLSSREHSDSIFVKTLSEEFDAYVNDAFSAAHRSHASLVGFTETLDSYAGRVMEEEVEALEKVSENVRYPEILVLGGSKPEDVIEVMEALAPEKKISKILLGGVIGELALLAMNYDIGKKEEWLQERGLTDKIGKVKEILRRHGDKIEAPKDLAYEVEGERKDINVHNAPEDAYCYDLGAETIQEYKEYIEKAAEVLVKGPMGLFEREGFDKGTKEILNKTANCDAFTVIGGGHTSSLVPKYGFDIEDFSHVSIAGGALIRFLTGEKLAALKALEGS